jgi:hypothetical protein
VSKLFSVAAIAGVLGPAVAVALGAATFTLAPASLAAAKSPARPSTQTSGPLTCELRVAPAGGGSVLVSALAHANAPASGRYSLSLAKDGDASGADMRQEGAFAVGAGAASTLSEVSMSLEPGASYSAVLTLSWGGGRITCRQAVTTRI